MKLKHTSIVVLAGLFGAMPVHAAVTVIGQTPAAGCFKAAATVSRTGGVLSKVALDRALASCSEALAEKLGAGDRVATLVNRGTLEIAAAQYDASIADSNAALQLDGRQAEAVVNLGVSLLLEHHPADAAADFTRALSLTPAHPEWIYFNRAMAREDMGDIKGAYADYRYASQLSPQWDPPKKELTRFTVVPARPLS